MEILAVHVLACDHCLLCSLGCQYAGFKILAKSVHGQWRYLLYTLDHSVREQCTYQLSTKLILLCLFGCCYLKNLAKYGKEQLRYLLCTLAKLVRACQPKRALWKIWDRWTHTHRVPPQFYLSNYCQHLYYYPGDTKMPGNISQTFCNVPLLWQEVLDSFNRTPCMQVYCILRETYKYIPGNWFKITECVYCQKWWLPSGCCEINSVKTGF